MLPDLSLRSCEIPLYAALGHIDRRSHYDVIDANVDLPLLIINTGAVDVLQRRGLVSLDNRSEEAERSENVSAS